MILAQNPSAAEFPGMPEAAIKTGAVDAIGEAKELPGIL